MIQEAQEKLDKILELRQEIADKETELQNLLGYGSGMAGGSVIMKMTHMKVKVGKDYGNEKSLKIRKGKKEYTQEEMIQLINDKTPQEIVEITGKTIGAVYMMKSVFKKKGLLFGGHAEASKPAVKKSPMKLGPWRKNTKGKSLSENPDELLSMRSEDNYAGLMTADEATEAEEVFDANKEEI